MYHYLHQPEQPFCPCLAWVGCKWDWESQHYSYMYRFQLLHCIKLEHWSLYQQLYGTLMNLNFWKYWNIYQNRNMIIDIMIIKYVYTWMLKTINLTKLKQINFLMLYWNVKKGNDFHKKRLLNSRHFFLFQGYHLCNIIVVWP